MLCNTVLMLTRLLIESCCDGSPKIDAGRWESYLMNFASYEKLLRDCFNTVTMPTYQQPKLHYRASSSNLLTFGKHHCGSKFLNM